MNIYHLSQTENCGYDTYDSCVVAAPDETTARRTHPADGSVFYAPDKRSHSFNRWDQRWDHFNDSSEANKNMWRFGSAWVQHPDNVIVKLLGRAAEGIEAGVICASFNAG